MPTLCVLAAITITLTSARALAQTDSDERARLHFQSGAAYYDAGQYEDALREFTSAYELSQRPQLFYNMYLCEQAIGDLEPAAEHLERYLAEVPDIENRETLEQRLVSLRERIARRAAGEADPGGEPETGRPIDAPHEGDGEGEGGGEGEHAAPGSGAVAAPSEPPEPGLNVPAIAAFAVAGVGLVGAVIFGPLTLAEDASLSGNTCAATRSCDTGTLSTYALLTDISFAVAAAGAVAGLVLAHVYTPPPDADTSTALRIAPFATGEAGGIVIGGAL